MPRPPVAVETWSQRFWRGFTTPSVPALAMASATVMALGGLSILTVGPGLLEDGAVRWLAASDEDDIAFVTARLLDMDTIPEGAVILLGGSGVRESFTSTEAVEQGLSEALGRHQPVVDLTIDAQSMVESAVLAAEVEGPATLLVAMSPVRFGLNIEELKGVMDPPRLGITNDVLLEELAILGLDPPSNTGWPILDFPSLYATRIPHLPINLVVGGQEQRAHGFIGKHPPPPDQLYTEDWDQRIRDLEESHAYHIGVFERLIERAHARGQRVVLYDGPLRTDVFQQPGETAYFGRCAEIKDQIVERFSLPVVDIEDADIGPTDFADPLHINNADAQARITTTLVEQLAALLSSP